MTFVHAQETILVEYYVPDPDATQIDDQIVLFCIRPSLEKPFVTMFTKPIEGLRPFINRFGQRNQSAPPSSHLEQQLHEFDWLIEPLAQWTEPGEVIYFVPHSSLHYFPFHALNLDGVALIERNPVAYLPSASVLPYCQLNRRKTAPGLVLPTTACVFGDSRNDLPYARRESRAIASMFTTHPYLGPDVTRTHLLDEIGDKTIIHLAVHGYYNTQNAMESGLLLAGRERLTARDIFRLPRLSADLVTLSGCETGINEILSGDELIGLTRAWLYIGTPSVLVSLWNVVDESTSFLMSTFYELLQTHSQLAKVVALQQAMLLTRSQPLWSSFYHWAPFILIGDWW